jgi:hypothetical protein
MSSTTSATFQLSQNMTHVTTTMTVKPHEISSSAQPMIRDRLLVSLVSRAISQPTALRS